MAVAIPWHAGETAMHELLKVPRQDNPTHPGLPGPYGRRIAAAHLIALGALDARRRPWATVWGGESGTAGPIAPGVLGIRSEVDGANDPVFQSLWRGNAKGIVGPLVGGSGSEGAGESRRGGDEEEEEGGERLMAGLAVDLRTRDRVKFAGRMVVGSATEGEGEEETKGKALDVQIGMEVRESLGNCPKYINRRDLVRNEMRPETTGKGLPLSEAALGVVGKADLFFLATVGGRSMDVNIRGGMPGFVRVMENDEDGVVLVYPECKSLFPIPFSLSTLTPAINMRWFCLLRTNNFCRAIPFVLVLVSGNRLYQTLGNLKLNPRVGITIPDFETSDVLYVSILSAPLCHPQHY